MLLLHHVSVSITLKHFSSSAAMGLFSFAGLKTGDDASPVSLDQTQARSVILSLSVSPHCTRSLLLCASDFLRKPLSALLSVYSRGGLDLSPMKHFVFLMIQGGNNLAFVMPSGAQDKIMNLRCTHTRRDKAKTPLKRIFHFEHPWTDNADIWSFDRRNDETWKCPLCFVQCWYRCQITAITNCTQP